MPTFKDPFKDNAEYEADEDISSSSSTVTLHPYSDTDSTGTKDFQEETMARTDNDNDSSDEQADNTKMAAMISPPSKGLKKRKKEFTLSDSDDDSTATGKGKYAKSNYPYKVIIVKSKTMQGFVFYATGFADKYISNIFYQRPNTRKYQRFLEYSEVVLHKCEVLENGFGTETRKNNKGYAYRAVAYVCSFGEEASEDFVRSFFEDIWTPALKKVLPEDALKDEQWPTVEDDSFETVHSWCDAVTEDDLIYVFANHQKKNEIKDRLAKWIQHPDRLYSLYNEGQVPKKVFKAYGLKREALKPLDSKRFYPAPPKSPP